MKIVCDNCATKYSIADEKVRGKVFKIRCKKCSHIIVVRGNDGAGAPQSADAGDGFPGDEQPTTAGAMPPASSGGGDSVWHLVVDREQVGPLTPQEVRAKFAAGEVDVETYGWREGFADWLRLGSIEDFRDLGHAAPAASQHDEGATRRTDSADLFASASAQDDAGSDSASDLFGNGGAPAPAAAPSLAPEVFSSAGSGGLFGAPDEAPAPAARPSRTSSPGFSQPASAAPMGGLGAESTADGPRPMAGQRNENSVLFSLNNLQALASGGGNGPSPSAAAKPGVDNRPGFANSQTEGSGLIDIRAMAASTLAAGPSTGSSSKSDDGGGFSAAPIFSPMAAPILMPAAPSGPPKWMWAILGVGVLAVIGIVVVGVLLLTRKPEAPAVVATALPQQPIAARPGAAPVAAPGTAPAGTPEPAAAKAEEKPAAEKSEKAEKHAAKAEKSEKHASAEKGTKVARAEAPAAAAPPPAAEPTHSKKKGGDALDALLDGASPDKSAPAAPKHAAKEEPAGGDDNLPDQLDKGAIVGGMGKVKGRVAGCYDQFKVPGMANVSVTIGKSGSVSSATVSGAFAGTPTGSCVEKAVKSASFPKFKGAAQTINYPFMLR